MEFEFESWVLTLDPFQMEKILRSYYYEHVVTKQVEPEPSEESEHLSNPRVKFHLDSIMLYDDPLMARLSFEILKNLDRKLINNEVKTRLKELGIGA